LTQDEDVAVAARQLVGRDEELGAIVRLLDAPEQLSGAAMLSGEAGIGKTTVWLAGIDAAAARGYRILSSRPSEAETRFSFAGLTDLLGNAAGDLLTELPPIQARALEAALLLGDSELHADERTVAAAFLGALRLLARDSSLCLAVDDVQWLDAASLAAVRFALARLDREPVAALLAARGDVPAWVRRAVPEERLRTVDVHGLSVGAIHELLRARLDARFPRPTLIRLWETSRGNPFFALELASALQRRGGTLAPGEEFPIPSDLDQLLHERLDGLGPGALEVARAVAALADPSVAVVEAVVGASFDPGLAEAREARILELDGGRLRFTHPLLSSAVAARQTPTRHRSLHARMAEVVPSAEERARHLAVATNEPDDDVAAALEEAALAAHARGAPAAAAELAEQALRLTPRSEVTDARRRLLLAADRYFVAGDTVRSTALLGRARAEATPGVERAAVLVELGDVMWDAEPQEAEALYRQALAEAEGDDALEARIHRTLAELMALSARLERGGAHATLAVEAALRTDDVALKCCALAVRAELRFKAGSGIAAAEMEEALALERALPAWPLVSGPTEYFCHHLAWSAELERARKLLLELVDARRAQHDAGSEAWALWNLALLEWRAGNWDVADRYATESLDLSAQLGASRIDEFPTATIAAHKGRVVDARALAHPSIAQGKAGPVEAEQAGNDWVLGFLALSLGDPAAALEQLRRSYERRNTFTYEPGQRLELGDLLEALIAVGELDEADEVLATWQDRADALDRAWALAILARCRGLLLAARGDLEGAFGCFERALAEHARSTDPFHHARTLLALGRTQRRAKRRAAARTTLDEALTAFERLGAPLWAEQARSELARIGGRAPSGGELTEAERRIAALVAEGSTNREVAAALFLTVHSVETALTRIYRKLDVRSRAELAHLLAAKS
jgi:DNA-binding CsgD family transcriptional regulator